MVSRSARPAEPHPADLRVREGRGHLLRRRAGTIEDLGDGWSRVRVDFVDVEEMAAEVASFAADVVVESPTALRDAVRDRLTAAAHAHGGAR
jgi:proteasome accessory factor B